MLLTAGCVALVLGAGLLLGTPLAWLLKGRKPLEEGDWLLAPALGFGAAILIAQNGVYLDWRIARVTPWIWAAAGALWLWLLLSRRPTGDGHPAPVRIGAHLRASWGAFPRSAYLVALVAYCVNGLGLLAVGASDYLGRAHSDQYNYTAVAQFLIDRPFSTDWDTVGPRPDLASALYLKSDRIGAEVLQGFLAATLGREARTLFEPTILLGPAWIALAVYALSRRLGQGLGRALAAGLAAGLMPGVALLHLSCFFSNVLAIPFVLLYLLALYELTAEPTPGNLLRAAILLSAAVAVYTEFTAVLLGLTVLCLIGGMALHALSLGRGLVFLVALPVLAVALNPLHVNDTIQIALHRTTVATAAGNPLEYAYNLRGLGCLWVPDVWALATGRLGKVALGFAVVMTLLAAWGLCNLGRQFPALFVRARRGDVEARKFLVPALGVVALAILPLAVLLHDRRHPYQFQKLLLSFSPLLVVGLAQVWRPSGRKVWQTVLAGQPLAAVLAVALPGTAALALGTTAPRPADRSAQHIVLDKDYRAAINKLRSLRGQNLVLAVGPGVYFNCWPAYAARKNNVWLVNAVVNDGFAAGWNRAPVAGLRPLPAARRMIDLQSVPGEAVLFQSDASGPQVEVEGDCHLLWAEGPYRCWRLGPGPYTLRPAQAALRP
jgi:hypothetical protein